MIPILFYGVPEGCSFGSIVALEWLGQSYRLCRVPMPDVVAGPVYRRINPVGETPTLLTADGRLVSESMAILNHLGTRAIDRGLAFPQGTPAFDRLNQMLAFLNTTFFNAFSPLWYALEYAEPGREALRAYGQALVAKAHAHLDALLAGRDWLAGDGKTLADAYFMGIARWADFHQVADRRDYPRVHALYERLHHDPGVRFAHAVEHQEALPASAGFAGEISLEEALALPALA